MRWAILVVWDDGEEEYLTDAAGNVAVFTKARAKEQVEFMKIGMDEYQSINVVARPGRTRP